jgi:hypothetical protein
VVRPLAEALDSLASPYAVEEHSALAGEGAFVVDLDSGDGDPDAGRLAIARATLVRLACPTVALCRGRPSAAATELFDRFDVVATSEAEAAPVLATAARVPIAATALAQLLRSAQWAADGLVAGRCLLDASGGARVRRVAPGQPHALAPRQTTSRGLVERRDDRLFCAQPSRAAQRLLGAMRDALAEALTSRCRTRRSSRSY